MIRSPYIQYDRTIDAEIRASVLDAIRDVRNLSSTRIQVFVRRRTVTLRGHLQSYYERQLILDSVRNVPGVLRIYDEFKIVRELNYLS